MRSFLSFIAVNSTNYYPTTEQQLGESIPHPLPHRSALDQ